MDRHGMQGALFLMFLLCSVIVLLAGNRVSVEQTMTTASVASKAGLVLPGVSKIETSFHGNSRSGPKGGNSRLEDADTMRRRLLQADDNGYIGYGALTGNNVPCPPQSGRSYYTPNCNSATGAVNPYTRGCSTISKCARDS